VQLKKKRIRGALATASCTLLGLSNAASAEEPWQFDSAVLFYSETDRVQAVEPVVTGRKNFGDDHWLNLKMVVDVLTGASANGATASGVAQTFTRPSGKGTYTAAEGETPLDDTFKDTRVALSASWEQPYTRLTKVTYGANFSAEYDFRSLSGNVSVAHDMNKRNTTLSAGISVESDQITPEGGIPTPFAEMVAAGNTTPREGDSETRSVIDLLTGVTQVVNRRMLMQFNYGISSSSGYMTDPFKIISVIDGTTGTNTAGTQGLPYQYFYEKRPDSRTKQSLFWQSKYHLSKDVVDISYRYVWDDWGITSHTLEGTYRWKLKGSHYLEPHVRFYQQGEADFYRHSLVEGEALPEYASADYRLGEFTGITLGLKYGMKISGNDASLRVEYYNQSGDSSPNDAIGAQKNQDLFPDINAMLLQLRYTF